MQLKTLVKINFGQIRILYIISCGGMQNILWQPRLLLISLVATLLWYHTVISNLKPKTHAVITCWKRVSQLSFIYNKITILFNQIKNDSKMFENSRLKRWDIRTLHSKELRPLSRFIFSCNFQCTNFKQTNKQSETDRNHTKRKIIKQTERQSNGHKDNHTDRKTIKQTIKQT